MAYTVGIIHPQPETVSHVFHQASASVRHLVTSFIKYRQQVRAAAELNGLSDQALADIGVSRCDIQNVVRTGRRSF